MVVVKNSNKHKSKWKLVGDICYRCKVPKHYLWVGKRGFDFNKRKYKRA